MQQLSLFGQAPQTRAKIELKELFEAYYSCRKNKRNTANAIAFEIDYESKLIQLCNEINNGTYKIGRSIAFIVDKPVKREIFAADFKNLEIPKGEYEMFTHKGKMENIKRTIFEIYKIILPKSNLKIEDHFKTGFLHFEKYDYRFQWNNSTSEIDIYLPLKTNK